MGASSLRLNRCAGVGISLKQGQFREDTKPGSIDARLRAADDPSRGAPGTRGVTQ